MECLKGIFDTHAHYDHDKFKGNIKEVISNIKDSVEYVCNVGTNFETNEESIELAKEYDFIYCSVGIHPFYADELDFSWEEKLKDLAKREKVIAIGEAGLDYTADDFNKKKQIDVFEKQLNIAECLSLPFIIHSREADRDTLDIVKNFPKVKGVVHCFSGDVSLCEEYIKMGWYIGFTGLVTFKNAQKTQEVAKFVPIDSFVVETDCPYLAPEPFRGKVCDSSMLKYVIKKIAELKNMPTEDVLAKTTQNAFNLYKLKI